MMFQAKKRYFTFKHDVFVEHFFSLTIATIYL